MERSATHKTGDWRKSDARLRLKAVRTGHRTSVVRRLVIVRENRESLRLGVASCQPRWTGAAIDETAPKQSVMKRDEMIENKTRRDLLRRLKRRGLN